MEESVLCTTGDGCIQILVVNPTDRPKQLEPGAIIGEVQPLIKASLGDLLDDAVETVTDADRQSGSVSNVDAGTDRKAKLEQLIKVGRERLISDEEKNRNGSCVLEAHELFALTEFERVN